MKIESNTRKTTFLGILKQEIIFLERDKLYTLGIKRLELTTSTSNNHKKKYKSPPSIINDM